ncbi:MAG TPA: serine hydrolase [Gemmatimonadaceae bacterium]|nr:serine hydrolase [Gemmatimonadaceae bacterium]
MRRTLTTLALLLASPLAAQQQRAPAPPPDFDAYVARVLQTFTVPGAAVAIVKDGKVVLAKGYGVKKLGSAAPVTSRTRFGIASNTKAFTATALGILVEEGKIEWDAPVVRYLPAFAMYDPWVTREITVRDLLVHRSGLGLGAGDLLWWPASTYDRKAIVHRLRFIRPATSFRSAYAYDNVLYQVAGELVEAVTGQSWEQFVSSRILAKVGMTQSNVSHADMAGPDVATPHAEVDGIVQPIAPFTGESTNPAGGINSTAEDMAKWMLVQLDSGRLADGARLFAPATTRQLWRIVTPLEASAPPPELAWTKSNFSGYALGFWVAEYQGRKELTHTGGLPGYVSQVTMIPELRLGVAVLTNQESGGAFRSITLRVLDAYSGVAPHDYPAIYARMEAAALTRARAAEASAAAARDSTSGPSLPLARYAGTYRDAWYGDVTIADEGGKLVLRFSHTPGLTGDLVHWQHDTFVARWRDRELRADAFVTFALDPDGRVERATMRAVSPLTDFSFDFQDLELVPVRR